MKSTLDTYQIADALRKDENADWSFKGAKALAEYLEEWEESTGEELELDVVAIRCDFSEYPSLQAWAFDYFGGEDKALEEFDMERDDGRDYDEDELDEVIKEYIQDNGQLIEFEGGIIVSSF